MIHGCGSRRLSASGRMMNAGRPATSNRCQLNLSALAETLRTSGRKRPRWKNRMIGKPNDGSKERPGNNCQVSCGVSFQPAKIAQRKLEAYVTYFLDAPKGARGTKNKATSWTTCTNVNIDAPHCQQRPLVLEAHPNGPLDWAQSRSKKMNGTQRRESGAVVVDGNAVGVSRLSNSGSSHSAG